MSGEGNSNPYPALRPIGLKTFCPQITLLCDATKPEA